MPKLSMKSILQFFGILLLLGTTPVVLPAQPILTAPVVTIEPGDPFQLDITASNFNHILSAQFSINWDSTIINFESISDFNLADLNIGNFGLGQVEGGKLRFLWYDDSGTNEGVTIDDNTVIFKINFTAIGSPATYTDIQFTGLPLDINVVDTSMVNIGMQANNGKVTMAGDPVSVNQIPYSGYYLYQNQPNPFSGETSIVFDLPQNEEIVLEFTDILGRVTGRYHAELQKGKHEKTFGRAFFPTKGLYYYTLITSKYRKTRILLAN